MVKIGVVGCGYWGPNLIRNFNSLPDSQVTTACDKDSARLSYISKQYEGIRVTVHFEELIKDASIDALIIATPPRFHYQLAKEAILSGKSVLIEKPMATSAKECRELIEIADQKKVTLMVGHTYLYSPTIRKIKEIYDSGEIGKFHYLSSRRLNLGLFQTDINVLWDLAPHDISIVLYVLNKTPIAVNCYGKGNVNRSIEDVANLIITFADGGFATIHNSWLDPHKVREMTIIGSKRMLVYNDLEPFEKVKIFDKRVEVPPYYDTFAEFNYSYHYGDIYSPYIQQSEPLKVECQHFVDCIKSIYPKPLTDGLEGLQVVQILESASESLRNDGARVEIKDFVHTG